MTSTSSPCPACGGVKTRRLTKRHLNGDDFYLALCSGCGQHYTDPIPTLSQIQGFYQGDYHSELRAPGKSEELFGPKFRRYRDWVLGHVSGGRSLDIGAATGLFPALLKAAGFHAEGLEFNPLSAEWGRTHYGVDIKTCALQESGALPGTYDLISMTDVLEHTPHPLEYLKSVRPYLKPGGIMLITFPDITSAESRYLRFFSRVLRRDWIWDMTHIPAHTWEFTPRTARAMFTNAGFEVIGFRRAHAARESVAGPVASIYLPLGLLNLPAIGNRFGTQMEFLIRKNGLKD